MVVDKKKKKEKNNVEDQTFVSLIMCMFSYESGNSRELIGFPKLYLLLFVFWTSWWYQLAVKPNNSNEIKHKGEIREISLV